MFDDAVDRKQVNLVPRVLWLFGRRQDSGYEMGHNLYMPCLLYTSPSPRDGLLSRMPSSA